MKEKLASKALPLQSTVAALEKALGAGDEGIEDAIRDSGAIKDYSAAQRENEVCQNMCSDKESCVFSTIFLGQQSLSLADPGLKKDHNCPGEVSGQSEVNPGHHKAVL